MLAAATLEVLCQLEAQMWGPALVRILVRAQARTQSRVALTRTVGHQTATLTHQPAMEMLVVTRAEAEVETGLKAATTVEAALVMPEAIQVKESILAMVKGPVLTLVRFLSQLKQL